MSSFTQPLILEVLDSSRSGQGEFRVHEPFSYDIGHLGSGDTVTVPAGYNTDLVSVPFYARPFISISGRAAKPALLHDWLLDQGDERAHDVFNEALGVAGVSDLHRRILVTAVRAWDAMKKLAFRASCVVYSTHAILRSLP